MLKFSTKPIVKFSVEHPWIIIAVSALISILMIFPIQNLEIEPDVESLLPGEKTADADQSVNNQVIYDKLLIMVTGEDLFTVDGLNAFQTAYRDLESVLPVEKTVDPFSQTILEKAGSRLTAVPLAPGGVAPKTEEDLKIFLERLEKSRFARGLVSSQERDSLVVFLAITKSNNYEGKMEAINATLAPLKTKMDVILTGSIPFSAETERFLTKGFSKLLLFVLATILLSYYLGFQSKRAVFLPVTIVISGTVFSLGIMAILGFKLTMVSIISPPLVLTLGSSYSIHVMNAFYSLSRISNKTKKELIVDSVANVSGTVMLASFTTLIGLLSLLLATIRQTREFAITTSIGILFTAFLSITLLPSFLALQPIPEKKKLNILDKDPLSKFLNHFGKRIINWHFQAISILVIITAVFLILLPRISFNTNATEYFPKTSVLMSDHFKFLKKMGGFEEMRINLSTEEKGGFLKEDKLSEIYNLQKELDKIDNVSYSFSFPEYLSYAGEIMTGKEAYFKSRGINLLVSRMFSTISPDESIANKDFSKISIILRVFNREENRSLDEKDTNNIVNNIISIVESSTGDDIKWELEGMSLRFLELSKQMKRDFLVSTIVALIMIGVVSAIAFKSLLKGFLALIPLLTGIFSSLILMALFRIPLDMTTIMVSCISIGVGVDDSIHFLLQYQKQSRIHSGNSRKAIFETLIHAGRPIVITTISIVAGLLFLSFAQFQPIRYFGLLIVFTLATACFSTLFILPPLLNTGKKGGK